jgi:hypothetical protein
VPRIRQLACAFAIVAFALLPLSASAGKGWCRSDPVVSVGGTSHTFEVAVNFPLDGSGHATGPTAFTATSPRTIVVLQTDAGVDGAGETVDTGYSRSNIVKVAVPTTAPYTEYLYVDGALAASCTTGSLCTAPF